MRIVLVATLMTLVPWSAGCAREDDRAASAVAPAAESPRDAQHQGITGPHGDHTPHHSGLVLMNGDIHYEVVLAKDGRHQVWFSDAMRNELPASIASHVTVEVVRPNQPVEIVSFAIDDAGEAWIASGRSLSGDGVMVKLRYSLQGEPHEIELPFTPGAAPQ
jgi:hypothetical protein